MARGANQKLKLLYLKQFFEEMTDEEHPATMPQILEYLKANDVDAECKSIYTDLDALADFGMDVRKDEYGKSYQWYDRDFELPEVKLIIDSVASSKFLSEKKSDALIKKLGKLVSEYQRKELRRQVRVMGRAKSMNNSVLINIDAIHAAIAANTTVKFKYFHYDLKLERNYSRKGKEFEASPWALLYDNDNYYLLAYNYGEFRTYRVDRMVNVEQGTKEREGREEFEKMDMPAYSKATFGMFNGEQEKVTMVFHNKMLDAVIDQFGKDVWLSKVDDEHFKVTVSVAVSPQFFAWVFGLEDYVTITGPDNVVKQMKDMLGKVSKRYEKKETEAP